MVEHPWHYYLMSVMYIITGFFHFYKPKAYLKVIPPYLPYPKAIVFWSGVVEIILGVGLLPFETKQVSIYLIVIMLIAFFPIHIYMLQSKKASGGIPKSILWIRLLLQFILIWWAFYYL